MMKFLVLVLMASPLVMCYDEKYDQMDVDDILADDAKFSSYLDCLLDKGECKEKYSEDFRKILPELIQTACEKCSPKQKSNVRKVVHAIKDKKPELFFEFQNKFNPNNEHHEKFMEFMTASD